MREPKLAVLLFGLPVIFVVISGAAFSSPALKTVPIVTLCSDPTCEDYVEQLRAARFSDGREMFSITHLPDEQEADRLLTDGTAILLIKSSSSTEGEPTITIRGDGSQLAFITASGQADRVFFQWSDAEAGRPGFVFEEISIA